MPWQEGDKRAGGDPQLFFWGNLRSIWAWSWKELGISLPPLGESTFPVLRDTGESKHLPKTGLNISPPVVLSLEISDCYITKPPLTNHFPETFSLYFPLSHSLHRPCNFYLHYISLGENSENQDFDQFFQRVNEKTFFASGRGCLFQPGCMAL